ncbi:MAG: ArnT family glycosyltransferase [Cyanobium sp.]
MPATPAPRIAPAAAGPGPEPLLLLLWLAAVTLALTGLGHVPLRDWDEAIASRVALELSQARGMAQLLPTFWGEPYLNKPPGLHLLMAAVIQLWRLLGGNAPDALPPEAVIRLAPALLSTLVVPLGGMIARQLRPGDRLTPVATAAILLTLLPIARHGRMAMLDGSQLSAIALLWWALLRSRSAGCSILGSSVVAGLAGSALLLLKAPMLLPVLAAGLLGLLLDPERPRRLWPPLALGLVLGLIPGVGWHLFHLVSRGGSALHLWIGDGAGRVLLDAGEGSRMGWRLPLLELLKGGWPWLPLWPFGLAMAWRERHLSSGRWPLVLQGVMAASILPLRTQLPWYSHPLWLPFALICAPALVWLVRGPGAGTSAPPMAWLLRRLPLFWGVLGASLLVGGLLLSTPTGMAAGTALLPYRPFLLSSGGGWLLGAIALMAPRRRWRLAGATLLGAATGFTLLLLMLSPLWNWELAEQWPVRPVAAMVRLHRAGPVLIRGGNTRPSLSWYAGQPIRRLRGRKRTAQPPTWLLSRDDAPVRGAGSCVAVDHAAGWQLLRCR